MISELCQKVPRRVQKGPKSEREKMCQKVPRRDQKGPKSEREKKCQKLPKVPNGGFHSIGATIRTRQESQCLPLILDICRL